MKKTFLTALSFTVLSSLLSPAFAVNLLQVYQQALQSDPTFKAAEAQEMIEVEAVPQSRALLLPQLNFESSAGLKRTHTDTPAGSAITKGRTFNYDLDLQQSIFNFSNWAQLGSAAASVKAANATYNAAAQDLMNRTIQAYFNVLEAQEILRYTGAEKRAIYEEYQRADQSFKVGLKTITDVYNAKAAYDGVVANYVVAQNNLANAKEDLRTITNQTYSNFTPLKRLQSKSPNPNNIEKWVAQAMTKNWQLVAARFDTIAAQRGILEAQGGHLPTVGFEAKYGNDYTRSVNHTGGFERDRTISGGLNLTMPLFSGGATMSQVREAKAKYELASQTQEKTYRDVINNTRKSYLGVMASLSKLDADQQAVISNKSALEGTQEGYKVGTRTMVDVLNAQETLYASQKQYASDRYEYIFNSVSLKEAAGTLSMDDIRIINSWLGNNISKKTLKTKTNYKTVGKKHGKSKKASTQTKTTIQIGAYSHQSNADNAVKIARDVTHAKVIKQSKTIHGKTLYLVRVITNTNKMSATKQKLAQAGYTNVLVLNS